MSRTSHMYVCVHARAHSGARVCLYLCVFVYVDSTIRVLLLVKTVKTCSVACFSYEAEQSSHRFVWLRHYCLRTLGHQLFTLFYYFKCQIVQPLQILILFFCTLKRLCFVTFTINQNFQLALLKLPSAQCFDQQLALE